MILTPLFLLIAFLTWFDVFSAETNKQRVQDWLCSRFQGLSKTAPDVFVTAPIVWVNSFADKICGSAILSWRAFITIAAPTFCLTSISLLLLTISTGKPMGMEQLPWDDFIELRQIQERILTDADPNGTATSIAENRRAREEFKSHPVYSVFDFLNRPENKTTHQVLISSTSGLAVLATAFLCWSTSRKILRKLSSVRDAWDLGAYLSLNLWVVLTISAFSSALLAFIVYPLARLTSCLLVSTSSYFGIWGILTNFLGHFVVGFTALYTANAWFRVVLGVCLLPTILLGALTLLTIIGSIWSKPIHWLAKFVLEKAVQYRSGPVAWSIRFLAAVTATIALWKSLP